MNPSVQSKSNGLSPQNLFEGAFERKNEYEQPEIEDTSVTFSQEHRQVISEGWADFYRLRTEDIVKESSVSKTEIRHTQIEAEFSRPLNIMDNKKEEKYVDAATVIEKQKGSSSSLKESGIKLLPDFKDIGRSFLGVFSLFKEIFMDTASLFIVKKGKKTEVQEKDPAKAKAAAEKKAENQRKQNNIKAFYEGLKAQAASVVTVEAVRVDVQEKANINKTIKMNESYKGIKDSFGRLTIYAASMFERAQLDEEKKAKKIEKEQKIASAGGKGPDMNLDKVAEGGFLSSTGGQGAG